MPRVAPGQRKRAYKPKSRGGCDTCKCKISIPTGHQITLRRVKCDEEKPSCLRCLSTGRKCDGYDLADSTPPTYDKGLTWKNFPSSPDSDRLSSQLTTLTRTPSITVERSEKEARSFHFFCQRTAPPLAGFFGDYLWSSSILQAAHHEPAIYHAVIALGSLHERFMAHGGLVARSKTTVYRDDFALQEYSTAIRALVQPLIEKRSQSMDVCLIACILFSCFESMQGSYGPSIAHINSGSKILLEMQRDPQSMQYQHKILKTSEMPYVSIDILKGTFMRLQVIDMVSGPELTVTKESADLYSPRDFESVADARQSLIWNWYYTKTQGKLVGQPVDDNSKHFQLTLPEWRKQSLARVDEWGVKLDAFIETHGPLLSESARKGVKVLQMHRSIGWTSLSVESTPHDDQTAWDMFTPVFEEVVRLAAEIIDVDDPDSAQVPIFSADMGITGPLYEVASRCRHPVVRRKAIALMKHGSRQEGIWNSFLTAKVAERVVEIEEQGCGEVNEEADVPDWARISAVSPDFDPVARKATLKYSRPKSKYDLVRKTIEEVIEW